MAAQVSTQETAQPSLGTMLWRGVRRRCAWCGGRGSFFRSWFHKEDRCRTCGITWSRGYEGFELGALTISTIVVMGSAIVAAVVCMILTSPDIPVAGLIVGIGLGAVALTFIVYPIGYTIWQAVDLAMHRPDPADPAIPPPRP